MGSAYIAVLLWHTYGRRTPREMENFQVMPMAREEESFCFILLWLCCNADNQKLSYTYVHSDFCLHLEVRSYVRSVLCSCADVEVMMLCDWCARCCAQGLCKMRGIIVRLFEKRDERSEVREPGEYGLAG